MGFGFVLTLVVLSGLNAVRILSELRSSNEDILQEFLRRQTRLDGLRSAIYLSGTYVRDYLLEPDRLKAEESRLALADTRRQIQSAVSATAPKHAPDSAAQAIYSNLQHEVEDYWQALDPVLAWDPAQRHRNGYRFLHDQVLPRRSSMLSIADTIASVNQQQLIERDHRLLDMFSSLRNRLAIAVAIMFLGGLALAFTSARYILRLESQTHANLQEVSRARQELRNLSARLVESQENERKNISRELHDAVGQSMSAAQFELHDLGIALAPYPEPLRAKVNHIREMVEISVAMVRNMALLLRPSMLDDLGLEAAIEWQANQISRATGIRIQIVAEGIPEDLPEEHKICIFRVVQEALNNVCKHARATSAEIHLRGEGERLAVTVRDDGRGFRAPHQSGLGLLGIQERVESLGGSLTVRSEPGKGARVEISLPLPQSATALHEPAEV
ncbi:MAG TPA: sensor histidine kinase [Bryobacteraceae bacterium]|nr:sensor histidine kinase [Bryobacteraceae bacterium]